MPTLCEGLAVVVAEAEFVSERVRVGLAVGVSEAETVGEPRAGLSQAGMMVVASGCPTSQGTKMCKASNPLSQLFVLPPSFVPATAGLCSYLWGVVAHNKVTTTTQAYVGPTFGTIFYEHVVQTENGEVKIRFGR